MTNWRCTSCGTINSHTLERCDGCDDYHKSWPTPYGTWSTERRYSLYPWYTFRVSRGTILDGISERISGYSAAERRDHYESNVRCLRNLRAAYALLTEELGE